MLTSITALRDVEQASLLQCVREVLRDCGRVQSGEPLFSQTPIELD